MVDRKQVKQKQEEEIIDRTSPPGEVVYEAVYAEGEHELERNNLELALSGLAAGLSMGFSMVGEALLRASSAQYELESFDFQIRLQRWVCHCDSRTAATVH